MIATIVCADFKHDERRGFIRLSHGAAGLWLWEGKVWLERWRRNGGVQPLPPVWDWSVFPQWRSPAVDLASPHNPPSFSPHPFASFLPSFFPSLSCSYCSLLPLSVALAHVCVCYLCCVFAHVCSSLTISATVYSGGPLWFEPSYIPYTNKWLCVCVHLLAAG